jgi:hypothetical protein
MQWSGLTLGAVRDCERWPILNGVNLIACSSDIAMSSTDRMWGGAPFGVAVFDDVVGSCAIDVKVCTLAAREHGPLFPPIEAVFGGGHPNYPPFGSGVKAVIVHPHVLWAERQHLINQSLTRSKSSRKELNVNMCSGRHKKGGFKTSTQHSTNPPKKELQRAEESP